MKKNMTEAESQEFARKWALKREEATHKMMRDDLGKLLKITAECREDMHEPDEQDVSAKVKGKHLDNAMGDDPQFNCGELTVGITKGCGKNAKTVWLNLASLIALARKAQV